MFSKSVQMLPFYKPSQILKETADAISSMCITFFIFIYNLLQHLHLQLAKFVQRVNWCFQDCTEKGLTGINESHLITLLAPCIQLGGGSRLFPFWLHFKGVWEENQEGEGSGVHCWIYFQKISLQCCLCIGRSSAMCFPLWFWPVFLSVYCSWYISPVESGRTCPFKILVCSASMAQWFSVDL